jgi:hypothetical protein
MSDAELLLAAQLDQAGIPYEREFRFHPERKWRADFMVGPNFAWPVRGRYLIEIEGGAFVAGRHTRGPAFEKDCEKYASAAILGYRVIRCTPRQVENGTALSWIRQALGLEAAA